MRLKALEPPTDYTTDKCVMLMDIDTEEVLALTCERNAYRVGQEIARAVNFHEPMLAAMQVFGSKEMGGLLSEVFDGALPPDGAERFKGLIRSIDNIIEAIELSKVPA